MRGGWATRPWWTGRTPAGECDCFWVRVTWSNGKHVTVNQTDARDLIGTYCCSRCSPLRWVVSAKCAHCGAQWVLGTSKGRLFPLALAPV